MAKPRGLVNMGNTCYLNSALQLLISSDEFLNFLEKNEFSVKKDAYFLKSFINKYVTVNDSSIKPASIKKSLARSFPKYHGFRQQDSQEFMANLLDAVEESMEIEQKQELSEIVDSKFKSVLTCKTCNHVSRTNTLIRFVSLAIDDDSTLDDVMEKFTEEEELTDGNYWKCDKCEVIGPSTKKLIMEEFAPALLIHLKRFNKITKINSSIKMPDKWHDKNLSAIIIHEGSIGGGHYYAFVRRDNKWYNANDNSVSEINITSVENASNKGYLFLYK